MVDGLAALLGRYHESVTTRWRSTPAIAWTQAEGPEGPPRTSTWPWFATAATLGIAFTAILFSDSLCPQHQVWVDVLCTTALVFTITAITGLVRGWSAAPFLALTASALGVAIGALDAIHSPLRGGLVVTGFVAAQVMGAYLTFRQLKLVAWDKKLKADSTFVADVAASAAAQAPAVEQPAQDSIDSARSN